MYIYTKYMLIVKIKGKPVYNNFYKVNGKEET